MKKVNLNEDIISLKFIFIALPQFISYNKNVVKFNLKLCKVMEFKTNLIFNKTKLHFYNYLLMILFTFSFGSMQEPTDKMSWEHKSEEE